jgi:hypothetical protein
MGSCCASDEQVEPEHKDPRTDEEFLSYLNNDVRKRFKQLSPLQSPINTGELDYVEAQDQD